MDCNFSTIPAALSAAGAFSLPAEKAAALDGAPIKAIFFGCRTILTAKVRSFYRRLTSSRVPAGSLRILAQPRKTDPCDAWLLPAPVQTAAPGKAKPVRPCPARSVRRAPWRGRNRLQLRRQGKSHVFANQVEVPLICKTKLRQSLAHLLHQHFR